MIEGCANLKPHNPWKTLGSRIAYENRWIRLREDEVTRPDGQPGIYGVVEVRPSVGVVAINAAGEVALVGQWRYPVSRYSWEIPRGGSEAGETDLLAVAQRELAEEAGVEAARWEILGLVDVNNGITTDVQTLYLATLLTPTRGALAHDPFEQVEVKWRPLSEAVAMVMHGEITEVCSVAALLKVDRLRLTPLP
jgi:8-oxo-dGTP pyrophosphatase MutT (NUDIX family)